MKATFTILAAVLTLNIGNLFAGNETTIAPVSNESAMISLAPVTPVEATFEDINATTIDIESLVPSMQMEADFNDITPAASADVTNLAPLTPAVADFNDAIDVAIDINALTPITPTVADFD